jgi:hypothetical protein
MIHDDLLDEEGVVKDQAVYTIYNICSDVIDSNEYIRVMQEGNDCCNYETRVLKSTLIKMGWTPPNK